MVADNWICAVFHPEGVKLEAIIENKEAEDQVSEPVLRNSIPAVRMSVGLSTITFFIGKPI
jgi:hypothetical protein